MLSWVAPCLNSVYLYGLNVLHFRFRKCSCFYDDESSYSHDGLNLHGLNLLH